MQLVKVNYNEFLLEGISQDLAFQMKNSLLEDVPKEIKQLIIMNLKSVDKSQRTSVAHSILKKLEVARKHVDFRLINASLLDIENAAFSTIKTLIALNNNYPDYHNSRLLKLFYKKYNVANIPKVEFSDAKLDDEFYDSLTDQKVWERKITKAINQNHQQLARYLNFVGEYGANFVTDSAIDTHKKGLKKKQDFADSNVILNKNTNEYFPIPSVSKQQYQKYSELLCFVNGLHEYAFNKNLSAVFVTITAPSKFHTNPNKIKTTALRTPAETKQTLLDGWQSYTNRVRQWKSKSFTFRVFDSHEDGTPHLHALLYFPTSMAARHKKALLKVYGLKTLINTKRIEWDDIKYSDNYPLRYTVDKVKPILTSNNKLLDSSNDLVRLASFLSAWGIQGHSFTGMPAITKELWKELRSKKYQIVLPLKLPYELEQLIEMAENNRFADFLELLLEHKKSLSFVKSSTNKIIGIQWQNTKVLSNISNRTIRPKSQLNSTQTKKSTQIGGKKPSTAQNSFKISLNKTKITVIESANQNQDINPVVESLAVIPPTECSSQRTEEPPYLIATKKITSFIKYHANNFFSCCLSNSKRLIKNFSYYFRKQ